MSLRNGALSLHAVPEAAQDGSRSRARLAAFRDGDQPRPAVAAGPHFGLRDRGRAGDRDGAFAGKRTGFARRDRRAARGYLQRCRTVTAFRRYLLSKLGQETVFDMRDALYRKVHSLALDYHGARRTGDTITRVTSDVKEVRSLLVDSVVEVGSSFLILIGMLVVMLWMSPSLTALALVTVPFLFLAVRRYRQALIERMRVVRAKEGAIASVIQEAVTGIRAVKIFAR